MIQQQQAADAGAAVSIATASATWIAEVQPWVQLGASAVAIVAGLLAAWYHWEKARAMRRERRDG